MRILTIPFPVYQSYPFNLNRYLLCRQARTAGAPPPPAHLPLVLVLRGQEGELPELPQAGSACGHAKAKWKLTKHPTLWAQPRLTQATWPCKRFTQPNPEMDPRSSLLVDIRMGNHGCSPASRFPAAGQFRVRCPIGGASASHTRDPCHIMRLVEISSVSGTDGPPASPSLQWPALSFKHHFVFFVYKKLQVVCLGPAFVGWPTLLAWNPCPLCEPWTRHVASARNRMLFVF